MTRSWTPLPAISAHGESSLTLNKLSQYELRQHEVLASAYCLPAEEYAVTLPSSHPIAQNLSVITILITALGT